MKLGPDPSNPRAALTFNKQGARFQAKRDRLNNPSGKGAPTVLLFTSSLGYGHVRATQAIEQALRQRMPQATVCTLDLWSLMDHKVAGAVRTAYLRLVQEHPDLYDRVYQLDQSTWREILESSKPLPPELSAIMALVPTRFRSDGATQVARTYPTDRVLLHLLTALLSAHPDSTFANNRLARLALVQRTWARLSRRFLVYIRRLNPDSIVATQMNPAALLSAAKKRARLSVPGIGVLTDFGVHDFWIQSGIDCYCLAHASLSDLRAAGVPADKVKVTGIPLMPGFMQLPEAGEARARLGFSPGDSVVLVAGGGLGLGVDRIVGKLLAQTQRIKLLVSVGRNTRAATSLAGLADRYPERLTIWHWTEQMEWLIRAADVVIGKPGGLTVAEALACGRPLIATHALQGQEGFNIRFLETYGAGRLVPEDQLVEDVITLLQDARALNLMQARAASLGCRDGALQVADLVRDFDSMRHDRRLATDVS